MSLKRQCDDVIIITMYVCDLVAQANFGHNEIQI